MKRIALALTALVAATAIAPVAYAGVDFDQLRRENLEKDAVNFRPATGREPQQS
jgi:hypothetical protein